MENILLTEILSGLKDLTNNAAVTLVEACVQASDDVLEEILLAYIRELEKVAVHHTPEEVGDFIHTVYKGFRQKSKKADAGLYFLMGYYARKQEDILEERTKQSQQLQQNWTAGKKHMDQIMTYLYDHGVSYQKDVVAAVGINKSNLSRLMNEAVACGLVQKYASTKSVLYELSPTGYTYCREHEWCNKQVSQEAEEAASTIGIVLNKSVKAFQQLFRVVYESGEMKKQQPEYLDTVSNDANKWTKVDQLPEVPVFMRQEMSSKEESREQRNNELDIWDKDYRKPRNTVFC